MDICDGPSSPIEMPLWVPTTFRLTCGYATQARNCSNPLLMTKAEKLETKGILPAMKPYSRPSANRYHVGFGDAEGEEAFGKFLLEIDCHGGLGEIRIAHHHVLIGVAQFHQRAAERLTRGRPEFQLKFGLGSHDY